PHLADPPDAHLRPPFPTRRSSDLAAGDAAATAAAPADGRAPAGGDAADAQEPERAGDAAPEPPRAGAGAAGAAEGAVAASPSRSDRKSTRLNSSHVAISYVVVVL